MIRSRFIIAFLVVLLVAGAYQYNTVAAVCRVPLEYRLGQFDDGFSITPTEAKQIMLEAEKVWEEEAEANLFVYNDSADFTVNFVFDERQQKALEEEFFRKSLDNVAEHSGDISAEYDQLITKYDELDRGYKNASADYETKLARHNQVVEDYNQSGGAPEDVYQELERERKALEAERTELNRLVVNLNNLVDEINAIGQQGNELVEEYNQDVAQYNERFGGGEAFTQGDYQGDRINIYTFKDVQELTTVLAHEFGHALSLDHVEGEESVMYYLMGAQPERLTLSTADQAEYTTVCVTEKRLFGFIQL